MQYKRRHSCPQEEELAGSWFKFLLLFSKFEVKGTRRENRCHDMSEDVSIPLLKLGRNRLIQDKRLHGVSDKSGVNLIQWNLIECNCIFLKSGMN